MTSKFFQLHRSSVSLIFFFSQILHSMCLRHTRYSTKFEIFINIIGVIVAAAAGAGQVCNFFLKL
jgi:hypothetical protein